jgi:prophage regulatory protein
MSTLIRLPEVTRRTTKSRSAIYAAIASGNFPKPIRIGQRAVAFIESEIDAWIAHQAESRNQRTAA